ncbi:MAG: ATP-binding protein [Planctomycetes bacterium]|nr:ATP-binding protein [Planctomycetota bacterium]
METIVSIPLSGNVVDDAVRSSAGRAAGVRRPACSLPEFLAGPENQLAGALMTSLINCPAALPSSGAFNSPAAVVRELNIDIQRAEAAGSAAPHFNIARNNLAKSNGTAETNGAAEPSAEPVSTRSLVVLYGPPGTGKSHLAFGLAEAWRTSSAGSRQVVYLQANDFWRQLNEAFESRTVDLWRNQLRSADLFVLEDLGQLASRATAQVELLHTLDALEARGALVVLTSRVAPAAIASLLPGLQSRLASALSLELNPPSPPTRRELIRRLAQLRGTSIQESAVRVLTEGIAGTAPELFGALLYLESQANLERRPINAALTQQYVSGRTATGTPTLRVIALHTARHFSLKVSELKSPSRKRGVVAARDTAMYLARQLTGKSLEQIGAYFGGRDHTTVLHGCRKIETQLETDPAIRHNVTELRQHMAGGA